MTVNRLNEVEKDRMFKEGIVKETLQRLRARAGEAKEELAAKGIIGN